MGAGADDAQNGGAKMCTSGAVCTGDRAAVLEFVRTPFTIRCNIVKAWRPLPANIWTALSSPQDRLRSVRQERKAILGVALMSVVLLTVFTGTGLRTNIEGECECVPLLGRFVTPLANKEHEVGWCYVPGASLALVFWTVGPSLAGWACIRLLWIPAVAAGRSTREATLTFARHLGCVYLFVYLMIVAGASTMPLFILVAPEATAFFRWCLWCFLFGESFFVPAVMWLRLVIRDSSGEVFGRGRRLGYALYLLLFVVVPIIGMVGELD